MLAYLNGIDQTILFFIQTNMHCPLFDKIMILATAAGDKGLIWIALSLLLLINKRTRNVGVIALVALALGVVIGEGFLKHLIQRPRPYADFPLVNLLVDESTQYSFPSGHTTASFAMVYVVTKYLKKLAPAVWALAIAIAFSRLYLFMHCPSDIVAGVALGLFCGKFASSVYERKIKKAA